MRYLFIVLISIAMLSCNKEKGCTNVNACNFIATADVDDGSCYSPGDDCDDGNSDTESDVYDNNCNCSGVDMPDSGCTDSSACNFNPEAEIQVDGSCLYEGDDCNDNNPSTINDIYNADCICEGEISSEGCMDSNACTYNPSATVNDPSSCEYVNDPCNDFNPNTINDVWSSNCDCEGETLNIGCMDNNACNFNPNANQSDNSCLYVNDPCDDGNSNTINDSIDVNCNCVGESTSSETCANNAIGTVDLYFGIYTDQYPFENTISIQDQFGTTLTTPVTPQNQNDFNEWYCDFCGTNGATRIVHVTDSYGDGLIGDGYYYVYCLTDNQTPITLVEESWNTGNPKNPETPISVSTSFVIP